MANIFLDYTTVGDQLFGLVVWAINFNTEKREVSSNFAGFFDPVTYPPESFQYVAGEAMYDECQGADRVQVIKSLAFPYGQVVVQVNAPSCVAVLRNSTNLFMNTSAPFFGDAADEVCSMSNSLQIFWFGPLQVGTALELEDGAPLTYSGSGWFRIGLDAVQINTDSEVITIVPGECVFVPNLPDLPDLDVDPILHLPTATSVNFVKDGAVDYNTDQNTLFAAQRPAGVLPGKFDQTVERFQSLTIQWGSSEPLAADNVVKVMNAATGEEVLDVPSTKVQENINILLTVPAVASRHPNVLGVQIHFPNYPFPEFAFKDNLINIPSGPLTGQYVITAIQDGQGSAAGNRVLVINSLVSLANPIAVDVTGKYNALGYDVYEAVVPFNTNGRYYLQIVSGDTDPMTATSEPIQVTESLHDYLELRYTHDQDEFGCYYGNQIIHKRWIKSRMYQVFSGGERVVNRQTDAKLVKVDEFITKTYQWQCYSLPPYLITQLSVALAHAAVQVNGIGVQTEEDAEIEYFLPNPLANMAIRVEETDFTQRVKYGSLNDSDSFLKVNEGLLKINS